MSDDAKEDFEQDDEGLLDFTDPEEKTEDDVNGAEKTEDNENEDEPSVAADSHEELEAIKARVREMEAEAEKLKQMQSEVEKQMTMQSPTVNPSSPLAVSPEDKLEADGRSVWVGNVDYGATAEELEQHFHGCGSINRVTIMCDKFSGHPKGFAYIEFAESDSIDPATALDDSLFRGRQIKVTSKRTNRPGISSTNRGGPRGRRGRGRGGYFGGGGGYRPFRRPYRRNFYFPY